MDDGLKYFIQELRDYGNARKGELAGMMLEAANRLEYTDMQLRMADRGWITDRGPTPEECEAVDATGFIICLSGTIDNVTYVHAIDMSDNVYEDGRWYLHGATPNKTIGLNGDEHEVWTLHGWMLPPTWGKEDNDDKDGK